MALIVRGRLELSGTGCTRSNLGRSPEIGGLSGTGGWPPRMLEMIADRLGMVAVRGTRIGRIVREVIVRVLLVAARNDRVNIRISSGLIGIRNHDGIVEMRE